MPFVASILDRGSTKQTFLFVFLSEHSVTSRWVADEWQAKSFQQVTQRSISVLPILIDDCQIRIFLADEKKRGL